MPALPRVLRLLVVAVALATAAAMALMWPGGVRDELAEVVQPSERARVVGIEDRPCGATVSDRCKRVRVRLEEGADAGGSGVIQWNANGVDPPVHVGDRIRVAEAPPVPGYDAPDEVSYALVDFERGGALLVLFAIFAVLVVAFSRLRGALSLLGLAASLAVILLFVVPAILNGEPPVAVAVTGSLAVMLVTICSATTAVAAVLALHTPVEELEGAVAHTH